MPNLGNALAHDRAIFMQLAKSDPEFLFELLKIVLDRLIIAELNVKKLTNAQEG